MDLLEGVEGNERSCGVFGYGNHLTTAPEEGTIATQRMVPGEALRADVIVCFREREREAGAETTLQAAFGPVRMGFGGGGSPRAVNMGLLTPTGGHAGAAR